MKLIVNLKYYIEICILSLNILLVKASIFNWLEEGSLQIDISSMFSHQ